MIYDVGYIGKVPQEFKKPDKAIQTKAIGALRELGYNPIARSDYSIATGLPVSDEHSRTLEDAHKIRLREQRTVY